MSVHVGFPEDHELSLNIWCKFVMTPCKAFYRFSAHAAFHEALQGAFGAALGFFHVGII